MNPKEKEISDKLLELIKTCSQPELQLNINNYSEFIRATSVRANIGPAFN